MNCWKCGAEYPAPQWGKLPFRASCDKCLEDLHCCKNCVYHKPGFPNDCAVPGTEFVADRAKNNLCEDFKIAGKGPSSKPNGIDPKARFNALFD